MNRRPLAAVASLFALAACAPDRHGDLRREVELRPAGAPSRLLFRGVGVGSSREEAREVFGEDALGPGDGARLGEHRTVDFGTDLQVLWNTEGGAVDHLVLTFTGNPIALGKLSDRWLEVFRHAGADCGEHACYWTEGDVDLATLTVRRGWYGPTEFTVFVDR
jgi:hypothetical protein